MPKKNLQKLRSTPPLSQRLELFAQVLEELADVAAAEPDPVRAQKLRGIARRLSVALRINEVVGVEWAQAAAAARGRIGGMSPKLKARNPLRAEVMRIMSPSQKSKTPLKDFLASWQKDPIDGLRLRYSAADDKFIVIDENGQGSQGKYSLGSLTTMYSRSGTRRLNGNRR